MRKNLIYSVAILLVAMVAAISCSKESSELENQVNSKDYKMSIAANFGGTKAVNDGGTATFSTGEKVYVCNTSDGNIIYDGYLSPDANGKSANLVGTINDIEYIYSGDVLKLLYNTNSSGVADYSSQDGTIGNVVDAAVATVTVSDVSNDIINTTSSAEFNNLQSVFKFTFKNGRKTVNVKSVTISSENNKLVKSYNAVTDVDTYGSITISNSTAQSTVYAALRFTATANDPISFTVIDEDNNVYTATKNAPSTGFQLNKFYNSTVNLTLKYTLAGPFSVSDTKKVYFSPGNLIKTDDTYTVASGDASYEFETTPYNYNGGVGPYWETDDEDKYGSLGWGDDPATTLTATHSRGYFAWVEVVADGDFDNQTKSGTSDVPRYFTVDGISDWYVLKHIEWDYLIRGRYSAMNSDVELYYRIKDNSGRVGLLIPPDDATAEDVVGLTSGLTTINVDYTTYTAKGFAFLPAAGGCLINKWLYATVSAFYLSTTEESTNFVYGMSFSSSKVDSYWATSSRADVYSPVRLVHD